jgi:hypothetical protein
MTVDETIEHLKHVYLVQGLTLDNHVSFNRLLNCWDRMLIIKFSELDAFRELDFKIKVAHREGRLEDAINDNYKLKGFLDGLYIKYGNTGCRDGCAFTETGQVRNNQRCPGRTDPGSEATNPELGDPTDEDGEST